MKYNTSIYQSAARTATPTAVGITDKDVVGVQVVIVTSAVTATPSVVVTIDGLDPLSNTFYNILTSAAIATTSTVVLRVHPDIVAAANLTAQDFLPATYRVTMTHGDTDSITYTVGINSIAK
jgi:hypothetical protein